MRRTVATRFGLKLIGGVFTRHPGIWLWLFPLLFLGFFFFYPLSAVFRMAGDWALSQGWTVDVWEQVAHPLLFTIWQALLSTVLTLALGY